jgi:hypothetical protein
MQKLMIAFTATAALVVCGSAFSQATPFSRSVGRPSEDFYSLIKKIGCRHAGDNCPYGQRIVRHGGHGISCEPCWSQNPGPKQGNANGNGDQNYRDYGNQNYRDYGGAPPPSYYQGYSQGPYRDWDDGDYHQRYYQDYSGGPPPGYEGPPPGWQPYNAPPYGWQSRGCLQFGAAWYCP